MNAARIVVLTIALSAGGVAAYLARSTEEKSTATPSVAQVPASEILVARGDIGLGQIVKPNDLQWLSWPAEGAKGNLISRANRPEAIRELSGSIARFPFLSGEPIREQKLVKATGSGFMAAILPTGFRAISTEIAPETGAGGFILPNDRVDVILSKRDLNPRKGAPDIITSEIILTNIRVLAIDQAPKEKEGMNVLVGKTATLELKPDQAETLARSRQSGTLSLALRSITDANHVEAAPDEGAQKQNSSVNVVRYGIANQSTAQK